MVHPDGRTTFFRVLAGQYWSHEVVCRLNLSIAKLHEFEHREIIEKTLIGRRVGDLHEE